jgi:hypothetical protein
MHNKYAPYWAITLIIFIGTGISTVWFDLGNFWKGYVIDMLGPAWAYILFRGLFTTQTNNIWTRFFLPKRTVLLFILICFGIETLQFFKVYDSTFDYWDLLAYLSILIPLHIIDTKLYKIN